MPIKRGYCEQIKAHLTILLDFELFFLPVFTKFSSAMASLISSFSNVFSWEMEFIFTKDILFSTSNKASALLSGTSNSTLIG